MLSNQTGQVLFSVAIALFAGVSGSLLTLGVTTNSSSATVLTALEPVDNVQPSVLGDQSVVDTMIIDEAIFDDSLDDEDMPVSLLMLALDVAAGERTQFAEILAQQTQKIETLEADLINVNARLALLDPVTDDAPDELVGEQSPPKKQKNEKKDRVGALVAAGVDPLNAEAYQAQEDQYQLARLDLIDLAEREGWRESDEFSRQIGQLEEQQPDLRSEIGDSAYDRFLFEAGRNNRVIVRSIISNSAAELAGVAVGDTIISYDLKRVFFVRELQNATREGRRGESTSITVVRDEQQTTLEVPRGPLGVTLGRARREP